jgi:hypothetical protein
MDPSANIVVVIPDVVVAVPEVAVVVAVPEVAVVVAVPEVVVAVPVAVPAPVDKDVEALFKAITTDSSFLARVKISVDKIMQDGKVDQYDIPEIVFVISETVNSLPSFQVTSEVVPVLIKMLYNFIVDTYNLVPADKKADFERMVDSSLRLLMMQPKIKEGLNGCFAFLSCKK